MQPITYRCELYFRTDTIGWFDAQERVLERVRSLSEMGVIDDAELKATWQGIETREVEPRPEAVATYEEFADWAEANDFSLKPAFDVAPRYVPGTTEIEDAVIFPVTAMAIYAGDTLRAVVPATDEFDHYTVQEALEGFERGDIHRWLSRFEGVTVDRQEPHMEIAPTV
jgi:hypothetical protein